MESSSPAQNRESESLNITTDFKAFQDRVTASLLAITKTATSLSSQDLGFHRSSSDQVSRSLERQNAHLLRLTNKLLKAATQETTVKTPQPKSKDAIDDNWSGIVDVVDDMLEKTDASLDEFTGAIKRLTPPVQDQTHTPARSHFAAEQRPFRPPRTLLLDKPQLLFDRKVDNHEMAPFKPLLVTKPHAIVPLQESLGDGESEYDHPYATEIETYKYPNEVYQQAEPIKFWPPEKEPAVYVDTEEGVYRMLEELKTAKEIAIDLEHHDQHTYIGLVCLMQISTRHKDWIVDTLKPWREKLQILNEVFTDPAIVKVFHGASMDMIWLQRDLGLYVVGLFDTYYACEALAFPGRGLKYLLERFADFEAQKQYQMSDWRQRPLGPELLAYARSDTHYLLYVYDQVRNLLVEASTPKDNLVDHVLAGSKKEALQKYERFVYNFESGRGSGGWFGHFLDRNTNFTPQQFAAYKALHHWRDTKARDLDESPHQVLKQYELFSIAEELPKNMTSLYKCFRTQPRILQNPFAREIPLLVAKAVDGSQDDPPVHEQIRQNETTYGERPQNRWRKAPRPTAANSNGLTGLAGTLKQLQKTGDLEQTGSPSTNGHGFSNDQDYATRGQQSDFWGAMMPFAPMPFMDPMMATFALNALLPLPDLTGNPFVAMDDTSSPLETTAQPVPEFPSSAPDSPVTDTFTLSDRHTRKRKAEEVQAEDNDLDVFANQSLNSITDADANAMAFNKPGQGSAAVTSERALTKSQRKAEKRAKRAAKDEENERKAREMVPFDYDAADTMLNNSAAPATPAGADKAKGKKPHMNPFAKALDTGTGARRNKLGQEGAGRSMTFKK